MRLPGGEVGLFPKPGDFKPVPLEEAQLLALLADLPGWTKATSELKTDSHYPPGYEKIEITRAFKFKTFLDAIDFMKTTADSIDNLDHHPRWENLFRTVTVYYSTWDIGHRPSDRDVKSARMLTKAYDKFIAARGA